MCHSTADYTHPHRPRQCELFPLELIPEEIGFDRLVRASDKFSGFLGRTIAPWRGVWRRDVRQVACSHGRGVRGDCRRCAGGGKAGSPSGRSVTTAQLKQIAYLKASNPEVEDHFGCGGVLDGHAGWGVAISSDGNTVAVGAPHESSGAKGLNGNQNDNSMYGSGAVYVFVRNGERWAQQAYVKPSNPQMGAEFGHVVALSADGNTLAVSAYGEASKSTGINGNQDDHSIPQAGAAYVFTRTGTTWTQRAYIKASNTGEAGATADSFGDGDQFGVSMTLSDDGRTLAIGAISEDSAASGINGNQSDNSATSAGAVYVFALTGNAWAQQAYVKAGNPDPGDLFGYSVSLSADGNTLAVGSYDEGGSSRGINGPPDNMRRGAGAVYIFGRTGTTWTQQAYIHASNAEGRRLVRGQRRVERRWEYAAGELAGRRLQGDRRQPAGM